MGIMILTWNASSPFIHPQSSFHMIIDQGNTVRHISAFFYCTMDDWNCLPLSVMLSNSVNYFKSRLNDAWKEHPLKFDADYFWFSCVLIHILLKLLRRGGVIIIIMVILNCYFSREHIALPLKKQCEHTIH